MRTMYWIFLAAAVLVLLPAAGYALDNCTAKIRTNDARILVGANDVTGALKWGYTEGAEDNQLADPSCDDNGRARNCEIGTGPTGITPPELCTIYLADDVDSCSAFIKKCTPGLRRRAQFLDEDRSGGTDTNGNGFTGNSSCVIGEVKMFAGNFAPNGTAFAQGQLLPIAQNTTLFAALGTTYGGNGTTTFALPDLRGRGVNHVICVQGTSPF